MLLSGGRRYRGRRDLNPGYRPRGPISLCIGYIALESDVKPSPLDDAQSFLGLQFELTASLCPIPGTTMARGMKIRNCCMEYLRT